jgi:hypothetical protein
LGKLRRYARRRGHFHLAVLLTIVVLTYVVVPWIVGVIGAGRGFNPFYYEPKDAARQDFVLRHGVPAPAGLSWPAVVDAVLVFAVVVVWLTLLPRGRRP